MRYIFAFLLLLIAETLFMCAFVIGGTCIGVANLARMAKPEKIQELLRLHSSR